MGLKYRCLYHRKNSNYRIFQMEHYSKAVKKSYLNEKIISNIPNLQIIVFTVQLKIIVDVRNINRCV